ncbi:acyl-CoA dehydrogenase family protein [Nocardia sp. NPDC005366]|uniref:acyl-CoA dehydrogenase family protein n=1 Tax=Nocardia sp. NPDC005366 TaxID=3156878 RepID=UPI00339DF27F
MLNAEQEELATSVRRFFESTSDSGVVRALIEKPSGNDATLWRRMANELGLQGLAIPEKFGGAGVGFNFQTIVFEQMGRASVVAPYFATIGLAASALLAADDDNAATAYLPGIADGTITATLAFVEDGGRWDLSENTTVATADGGGFRLHGHKNFVTDGAHADVILVLGATGDGPTVFAVEQDAAGLTRTALDTLDLTRRQARLQFEDTPAVLVGASGRGTEIVTAALDVAAVALAAEQVGGAQRCLDMSVEYAKVRTQFGRKIGSFQAIKHKCADMLVAVESARSAVYYAASLLEDGIEGGPELGIAAAMAQAVCSEAFVEVAQETIQIHGGIGFTWEHDAHLYYRRAQASAVLLGDAVYHRESLAQRLGF